MYEPPGPGATHAGPWLPHAADPRPGATTYGFNCSSDVSNLDRAVYDFTQNTHPVLTIFDPGGANTLDTSGTSADQTINLTPGSYSSLLGMQDNVALAYETTMQNAIGGSGADTFITPYGNFNLDGGGGTAHTQCHQPPSGRCSRLPSRLGLP